MDSIKVKLGRRFKKARLNIGLSRRALGVALGLSGKTIHGWESGRTFIQDLDLLPEIMGAMRFSLGKVLAKNVTAGGSG